MRVLPPPERAAMYAIYDFCRIVDDIADDHASPRAPRQAALDLWRADIGRLYAGGEGGQAAFLAPHIARFQLPEADFVAVIDGMAMDIAGDIVWPDWATLDLYCDRVASAVGRLSVRVFGMDAEPGPALAHHLGRALQLTNILRDIDEDAAIGRVYLPDAGGGATLADPAHMATDPAIDAAARPVAARAAQHFAEAEHILSRRPRGHLTAPRLMAHAYAGLLRRMTAAGWAPPRRRARVGKLALVVHLVRLQFAA